MSKNQVAKSEPTSVMLPPDADPMGNLLGFGDDEGLLESYKMQYHGDKDAGLKSGLWTLGSTGEQAEHFDAIVLAANYVGNIEYQKSDPFDPNLPPICFSNRNGIKAVGGVDMRPAKTCLECGRHDIKSWWAANKTATPCNPVSDLLLYDPQREQAATSRFSAKNRTMLSNLRNLYKLKRQESSKDCLISWQWLVRFEIEEDGRALRPLFSIVGPVDKHVIEALPDVMEMVFEQFEAATLAPKDVVDENFPSPIPAGTKVEEVEDDKMPF